MSEGKFKTLESVVCGFCFLEVVYPDYDGLYHKHCADLILDKAKKFKWKVVIET